MKRPAVHRSRLANGMSAALQVDRRDPVVAVSLLFRAGSSLDPDDRRGLAGLCADTMERGSSSTEFVEFSRRFERIGSNLSVQAGAEMVHIGANFLARHADEGLGWIADLLEDPGFRESDFDVVRSLARSDFDAREDDLDDIALELLVGGIADGHPYGKLPHGTREGVDAARAADLRPFHGSRYRPDRAHVAVVGDLDEGRAGRVLDRLGGLANPTGPAEEIPPLPESVPPRTLVRTRTDKTQAKIFLGGPGISVSDPDRLAAIAMNHILGGSSIRSRLGDEIRDRRGLAYSVSSRNTFRSHGGFFEVSMGTRPENVRRAVEAIRAELERITEGVTDEELSDARAYLTGSFPLRFTTYGSLARFWTRAAFYGWPEDYLETYVSRVQSLASADLRRAAQRLAPRAQVLAVAGPVDQALAPARNG